MLQLKLNTFSVQMTKVAMRNTFFLQEMHIVLPFLPFCQNLSTDRLRPWDSATPQILHYLFGREHHRSCEILGINN